jgi:hypothetical protein
VETTMPISISINRGSSPRNMPPKIKLANVNFATSSNDFLMFSFTFGFSIAYKIPLLSIINKGTYCQNVEERRAYHE